MVVLGAERTIEQDPAFAIRIMVDIADKALSAAINDPTTAVQVLNYLGESLRMIGTIDVSESRFEGGVAGRQGVVMPVRGWEDYLALAITEIREYGASSIQVMRRMRAMLEELLEEVPERRRARRARRAGPARRHRRAQLRELGRPRSRAHRRSAGDGRRAADRP